MINAERGFCSGLGNKEERETQEEGEGERDANRYTNNDLHRGLGTNSGRSSVIIVQYGAGLRSDMKWRPISDD